MTKVKDQNTNSQRLLGPTLVSEEDRGKWSLIKIAVSKRIVELEDLRDVRDLTDAEQTELERLYAERPTPSLDFVSQLASAPMLPVPAAYTVGYDLDDDAIPFGLRP